MKTIQAAEAKAKFSALLRDVSRGETVIITLHGKSVAQIGPPAEEGLRIASEAVDRLKAWRKTLPPTEITVADILSGRDEGRP